MLYQCLTLTIHRSKEEFFSDRKKTDGQSSSRWKRPQHLHSLRLKKQKGSIPKVRISKWSWIVVPIRLQHIQHILLTISDNQIILVNLLHSGSRKERARKYSILKHLDPLSVQHLPWLLWIPNRIYPLGNCTNSAWLWAVEQMIQYIQCTLYNYI